MTIKFSSHKSIIKDLIIVDGIVRSGKTCVASILSTLQNFEHVEFTEHLDQVIPALNFKKMTLDFAKAYINTCFNETAYNKLLSRKINFRSFDYTGVQNSPIYKKYLNRLKVKEGDQIIRQLKNKNFFFLFLTHEIMMHFNLFNKFNLNYKFFEIYRNPIDNIYTWYKRGWGTRFGEDPRYFNVLIENNKTLLPWYCAGKESLWKNSSPIQRCTNTVIDLIKRSVVMQKKYKNNKNIYTINFEEFVSNTDSELKKVLSFLKVKKTKFTNKILLKERCPRNIDLKVRCERLYFIKHHNTVSKMQELNNLISFYEKNTYGFK